MNKKLLLLLLIILQLGSCNKRYAYLKKIKVPFEKEQTSVRTPKQKILRLIKPLEPFVTDSLVQCTNNRATCVAQPVETEHYQFSPPNHQHKNFVPPVQQQKYRSTKIPPDTENDNKNTNSLYAFIFALLVILSIPLFFFSPLVAVICILLFAIGAVIFGRRGYTAPGETAGKRRWMAITGIATGSIILAFALASGITVFLISIAEETLTWEGVAISTLRFFIPLSLLLLLGQFAKQEKKKDNPGKPDKYAKPSPLSNRNKLASVSLFLLVLGLLSTIASLFLLFIALILVSFPVLLTITVTVAAVCLLASIVLAIIALHQIKTTHEKGKGMALIPLILISVVLLLIFPLFFLPALIAFIAWRVIRRYILRKREKARLS